jgi:hypothetical protein
MNTNTMTVNPIKTVRGLKIALSRKANSLNVKIVNLVVNGNGVSFTVDPSSVEAVNTLNSIVYKLGYTIAPVV